MSMMCSQSQLIISLLDNSLLLSVKISLESLLLNSLLPRLYCMHRMEKCIEKKLILHS